MQRNISFLLLAAAVLFCASGAMAACTKGKGGCQECAGTGATARCVSCVTGYDLNTKNTCTKCNTNCAACDYRTPTKCDRCIPRYYRNAAKACLRCPEVCESCTSPTRCTRCKLPNLLINGKCGLEVLDLLGGGGKISDIVQGLPITDGALPLDLKKALTTGSLGKLLSGIDLGGPGGKGLNLDLLSNILDSTGNGGLLDGLLGPDSILGGLLGGSGGGLLGGILGGGAGGLLGGGLLGGGSGGGLLGGLLG